MMLQELLQRYPQLEGCREQLVQAVDMLLETYHGGGKILLCGNGGSCADCDHIVGELMKGFLSLRPLSRADKDKFAEMFGEDYPASVLQYAVPAISLPAQAAVLSAFANDVQPDMMYAQLMYGYGTEKDTAIGLSTSGNSGNVVNAMKAAKVKGMKTIALTGQSGGKLKELCDVTIRVPETETFKVQELHLPVYHYICATVEARLF